MLSKPIEASLFPQVALDSSIAKIPLPGDATLFYYAKTESHSLCLTLHYESSGQTNKASKEREEKEDTHGGFNKLVGVSTGADREGDSRRRSRGLSKGALADPWRRECVRLNEASRRHR